MKPDGIPVLPYLLGAFGGVASFYFLTVTDFFDLGAPIWDALILLPPISAGVIAHKLRAVRKPTSRFAWLVLASLAAFITMAVFATALLAELASSGLAFADPVFASAMDLVPVAVYVTWLVIALIYEVNLKYRDFGADE